MSAPQFGKTSTSHDAKITTQNHVTAAQYHLEKVHGKTEERYISSFPTVSISSTLSSHLGGSLGSHNLMICFIRILLVRGWFSSLRRWAKRNARVNKGWRTSPWIHRRIRGSIT